MVMSSCNSIPVTNPSFRREMALCASPSLKFNSFLQSNISNCSGNYFSRASISVPRVAPRCLGVSLYRRNLFHLSVVALAASQEDSHPDEVQKEEEKMDEIMEAAQKAWNEALASFKEQALKVQSVSQEAYEVYASKALPILKETSEKLKIQADKASKDLSVIALESSEQLKIRAEQAKTDLSVIAQETSEQFKVQVEKTKEDLNAIAQEVSENCPEPVRGLLASFLGSFDGLTNFSQVQDFHIGIPYGFGLAVGGFLSFMLTGSVSAIRFGVILGGILLAISISSLQAWKEGQLGPVALKGQAAISSIIFLRELRVVTQSPSLGGYFTTILSGAMLALYIYRFVYIPKRSSLEPGPDNSKP